MGVQGESTVRQTGYLLSALLAPALFVLTAQCFYSITHGEWKVGQLQTTMTCERHLCWPSTGQRYPGFDDMQCAVTSCYMHKLRVFSTAVCQFI